MKLTNR